MNTSTQQKSIHEKEKSAKNENSGDKKARDAGKSPDLSKKEKK